MIVTKEDLDRFHDFATHRLSGEGSALTWRELFELWRLENPSEVEHADNLAAIQESLDAMEAGYMRPVADFDAEFRQRHGITDDS